MVLPLGDSERTAILPIATYLLIAANVVVYFVQVDRGEAFTTAYAATPYEVTHNVDLVGPVEVAILPVAADAGGAPARRVLIPQGPVPFPVCFTLLTAMFLHASPLHLAGNMLYLWIFGDNVEEVLGHVRYVLVYLCCGLAASLLQMLPNPDSPIPTLGASGAVAGMMGAYLVWFPRHRVRVLVFRVIVEVPAVVVIGLWIGFQVWRGLGSLGGLGHVGGVAYLAHVGGVACGLFVGWLFLADARRLRKHPTAFDRVVG